MTNFSREKTSPSKKITESDLLAPFKVGDKILGPLTVIERLVLEATDQTDARVALGWGQDSPTVFTIQVKTQNTPLMLRTAMQHAQQRARASELPLVVVPYLSPAGLVELEHAGISGIDLCGNGVISVPGRLYIYVSGQPNQFPQSRPLNNPYRGRSAMLARLLLAQPKWGSLSELAAAVRQAGCALSLPQASKAVQALRQDLMVAKTTDQIVLTSPLKLLDKLGNAWQQPQNAERLALRLSPDLDWTKALLSIKVKEPLKWAIMGESSAHRYTTFVQSGPRQIAVSNLSLACSLLEGTPDPIRNFADIELVQTNESGFYFMNEVDETGACWASKLQTWLELNAGDARQQQAAQDLYNQLAREARLQ